MGNNSSAAYRNRPLAPQRDFVGNINARFKRQELKVLTFRDRLVAATPSEDFAITDARNGQIVFRVPAGTDPDSDESPRILYDAYGVPIARLERKSGSAKAMEATYDVIPGGRANTDKLCTIVSILAPLVPEKLRIELIDPATGNCVILSRVGNWRGRSAVISLQASEYGTPYAIAKIYRTAEQVRTGDTDAYTLEVAPGVDIALMVLIAWAVDEQTKLYEDPSHTAASRRWRDKAVLKEANKSQRK